MGLQLVQQTFVFLDGISRRKEQALWRGGIHDWNEFIRAERIAGISPERKSYYDRQLRKAQEALTADDSTYFCRFPSKEQWRLYEQFKDEAGYVDVEVDSRGKIIVIGISDYYTTHTFVRGINLEKTAIEKELEKYKIMVTFNGRSFDAPKLKKEFGIEIRVPHIDLKPLCIKLGMKGGLKEVEKQLNLQRPPHLHGNPVDLWKAFHASGDREWLDLLIAYNSEDIENLKWIMDHCYKEMEKGLRQPV
ncbi:MAG: ribonuclease H-like domain-containing protein [Candidatus Woesearchaeota archaeon]|nr:ribonuclease H-like domain-containing protein [Candidatus Woesearchaeota archaeon]